MSVDKRLTCTSLTRKKKGMEANRVFVAGDNGVTGLWCIMGPEGVELFPIPTRKCRNYTKSVKWLRRVDVEALKLKLLNIPTDTIIVLERPFVNPRYFSTTLSAVRSMEAVIIALESLGVQYRFVDSREWQKVMLPGIEGRAALKKAAIELGKQLYPTLAAVIDKYEDADGLLIAEWTKRKYGAGL